MPELPEVETMRRGVLPAAGSVVADVRRAPCACKPIAVRPRIDVLRRRVVGRRVAAVDRVGKRVVFRLESGDSLVIEPRMTGLLLLADPPDEAHLRLRIDFCQGPIATAWFWDRRGLGRARLYTPDEFAAELGPDKLGPDALEITADELRARLAPSSRAIKVALLDQRALAGVGNLYASEILHLARVHPATPCARVSAAAWARVHEALRRVLEEAIRHEGSTLADGTYRNVLNSLGGYQHHHRVYDRAGQICPSCGQARVRRVTQAQRSTFFCPTCQRRG